MSWHIIRIRSKVNAVVRTVKKSGEWSQSKNLMNGINLFYSSNIHKCLSALFLFGANDVVKTPVRDAL
jgi:hypothetical protein